MNDIWVILRMVLFFLVIVPWLTNFSLKWLTKIDEGERFWICILTSMILFIVCMNTDMGTQIYKPYTTRSVVAMQDSEAYIVSRYSVDSEMKYYYITESNGIYRTLSAPSNRSIIKHTNEKPKVDIYKKESKYKIFNWILPAEYVDAYRYEFYIPKGSIKEDIGIDLN